MFLSNIEELKLSVITVIHDHIFFRETGWIAEVGVPQILVEIPLGDKFLLNRDAAMLDFCDI
jgi:hypothetical protein